MEYRPSLRPELVYLQQEGTAPPALYDPVLHRRVNLGAVSRALVARLDGLRPLDVVLEEVRVELARTRDDQTPAAAGGQTPAPARATVEHTFRTLLLMNLVDGSGRDILDRALRVRTGAVPYEPLVLEEARFACQGSGECCQNYAFGPLTDEDVARIEALDPRRVLPHLGDRPYVEAREVDGETQRFLGTDDDRCLFLQEDLRCGLHAHFGADAKPGLCRLYPITTVPTLDGLKIYDNGECASFAVSARSGPSLREQVPSVRALLPDDLQIFHPLVLLDERTPCDYGHVLSFQRAACALVATAPAGGAAGAVAALGRLGRAFVDGLVGCALAPGEPDDTVAAVLGGDLARYHVATGGAGGAAGARVDDEAAAAASGAAARRGFLAIATVAGELLGAMAPAIASATPSLHQLLSARLQRQLAEVAHLIDALASHRAAAALTGDADVHAAPERPGGAPPLDPWHRRIAAIPLDDPALDDVLRRSLRTQLFGHRALVQERLQPALLRIGFVHLVTVLGARLAASVRAPSLPIAGHGPRATLDDVSTGHMLAMRGLRQASAQRVFVRHAALAWDVLAVAATLCDEPSALVDGHLVGTATASGAEG